MVEPAKECSSKEFLTDIRVRVSDVEKSYAEVMGLIARREERYISMEQKLDHIYYALVGNIESNAPGIITRVDRLEQTDLKAETNKNRLWAGIGVAFVGFVVDWFKK